MAWSNPHAAVPPRSDTRINDSSYTAGRMATARAETLKRAEPDAGAQEFLRVDRLAVGAGLIVQMRAGRSPGRADPADDLADAHRLTDLHVNLREMAVTGGQAIAVVDLDHVAIAAFAAGDAHFAGGGGVHRFAGFAAQVDTGMDGGPAQERVEAHAERRTHVHLAADRLAHRHGDQS